MPTNSQNRSETRTLDDSESRPRIAVLEDDPDQAEIVELWLNDAGYSVQCFLDSAGF